MRKLLLYFSAIAALIAIIKVIESGNNLESDLSNGRESDNDGLINGDRVGNGFTQRDEALNKSIDEGGVNGGG